MNRIICIVLFAAALSGCVYRKADIPFAPPVAVDEKTIYIRFPAEAKDPNLWRVYAGLAADLEKAGFNPSIVSDLAAVPEMAPLIEGIHPRSACFSEPMFTVLTAGLIPHISCVQYGHKFNIRRKGAVAGTEVDTRFKVRVMVGWLTWPAALSKAYAYDGKASASNEANSTALMLLRQRVANALSK